MNQLYLSGRPWMIMVVLLLLPVLTLAQSPYEGIYIGTYHGTSDNGQFALIVNTLGHGTLAAYDAADDVGYVEHNIRVNSDGNFHFVTQRGAQINGQASTSGVSGSYYATGTQGSFSGQRMSAEGPLEDATGYYTGPVSFSSPDSNLTVNGRMVALIAADGTAFFLIDRAYPGHSGFRLGNVGFDFDIDLGFGLDLDFTVGGAGFYGGGTGLFGGGCGIWGFGSSYNFGISVLGGIVDLDFTGSLPSCSNFWSWDWLPARRNAFPAYSGGIVQIGPEGNIHDSLLDSVALDGDLKLQSGSAEGTVTMHQGATTWTGYWTFERRYHAGAVMIAKRYSQLPDFDGNGNADFLWRHAVSGESAIWLMDSSEIAAELPPQIPEEIQGDVLWSLAAVIELNADARSDFVWRHQESGEVFIDFSDGAGRAGFELDPVWKIVGSGDFDTDSKPDLLLTHRTSGDNALVTNLIGSPDLTPFPAMEDQTWTSVSVADFDGDNAPDLLFMNRQTRELAVWLMDGTTPAEEVYLPTGSGHEELVGVGDFDQDGATDILRRDHAAGTVTVTSRLGKTEGRSVLLAAGMPRGWQVAAVGDLDGDGSDDLVWRQTETGENVSWRVVDSQVADTAVLMPVPNPNWSIQQ